MSSVPTKPEEQRKRGQNRLSGWWSLISFAAGLAAALLVGHFATEGAAEIAGVMAAVAVFSTKAFWDYHVKSWFAPLLAFWIVAHLAVLFFFIVPMKIQGSKLLLQLIWPDFFAFVGVIWLASKLWGGFPED